VGVPTGISKQRLGYPTATVKVAKAAAKSVSLDVPERHRTSLDLMQKRTRKRPILAQKTAIS
jgi:hypothetical protein